jgi:hypothetical protein
LVLIREKALLLLLSFVVLSIIKSHILVLTWDRGACSGSSYSCSVGCITILPLDWLDHWVIQIDDQVSIDLVLVRWLRFISLSVITSCLGSAVICCNPIGWREVAFCLLNSLIIYWVLSGGFTWVRRHEVVLAPVFHLVRVYWRRHVKVLLLLTSSNYNWIWWVILISDVTHYCGLVCWIYSYGIFSPHSHLFLKIYFGLLVTFLAILELSVSFVY